MPDARDVILKHIAAVNDRDSDAEPWAADAELVAPGGRASGRDGVDRSSFVDGVDRPAATVARVRRRA